MLGSGAEGVHQPHRPPLLAAEREGGMAVENADRRSHASLCLSRPPANRRRKMATIPPFLVPQRPAGQAAPVRGGLPAGGKGFMSCRRIGSCWGRFREDEAQ